MDHNKLKTRLILDAMYRLENLKGVTMNQIDAELEASIWQAIDAGDNRALLRLNERLSRLIDSASMDQ